MNDSDTRQDAFADDRSDTPVEGPPVIDSHSILGSHREVRIRHEGDVYRLRVTRNGRLILNK